MNSADFRARVAAKRVVAHGVFELTLAPLDGGLPPAWMAGAHIDILFEHGTMRQYSLVGTGLWAKDMTVSVLLEPESRGGSRFVHEQLEVGAVVGITGPRNNFRLLDSPHYLFIAGGIGITPIVGMIEEAEAASASWSLLYLGRSRSSMAYLERVESYGQERVRIVTSDAGQRVDLAELLRLPQPSTLVYCCGPARLLDAVHDAAAHWPTGSVHSERFAPKGLADEQDGALASYEVELRRSGMVVDVHKGESIGDVCESRGVMLTMSCREGICGSCETAVVAGVPAHRDSVLSQDDRESGAYMLPCVSGSRTSRLVLDL